jgi:3-methyladenine DNA glycosylase/8-oxoguanine DNA glycosylase
MLPLGVIRPEPPYAFETLLAFLGCYRYPTLDIVHQGCYWRVVEQGEALALLRTSWAGTVDQPVLNVDLAARVGEVDDQNLLSVLGHILSAGVDRAAFFRMARSDDRLWSVIEPLYGLPELRSSSIFEALMRTIIEQQIAWVSAQRAQRWLVVWAGRSIPYDGRVFYAFPSPDQIAGARLEDLKPLKITHGRIQRMIGIAESVATGRLDLEAIQSLPAESAYEALLEIKGVGHWTAAVTLRRALGYDHQLPYNDVALQAAANHYFFHQEGRATAQAVMDIFMPYGDMAGKAASYTLSRWVMDRYRSQT